MRRFRGAGQGGDDMADEPLRVLICDDEPGMRLILGKLVGKAEGFEVVGEAENGEQALEMFEKTHPQVVFLDVEMPVMDGVETARRIQDMDPHAALVFATAHEGTARKRSRSMPSTIWSSHSATSACWQLWSASAGCSEAGRICRQKP